MALAAGAFAVATLASALAWASGAACFDVRAGGREVVPRYAVGSLVNSFAPAPAGEAARVTLVGRVLERHGGVPAAVAVCAGVAAARVVAVSCLFVAVTLGSPVGRVAGTTLVAALLLVAAFAVLSVRRGGAGRAAGVAAAVRAAPGHAARVLGWVVVSTAAGVAAAACCCAALSVSHPLAAAAVVVPAVELARLVAVTPGNIGITSAAVTVALRRHHVPLAPALSAGLVLHAVETAVGIGFGLLGAAALARPGLAPRLAGIVLVVAVASAAGIWIVDAA